MEREGNAPTYYEWRRFCDNNRKMIWKGSVIDTQLKIDTFAIWRRPTILAYFYLPFRYFVTSCMSQQFLQFFASHFFYILGTSYQFKQFYQSFSAMFKIQFQNHWKILKRGKKLEKKKRDD